MKILITGGSQGLGLEISKKLSDNNIVIDISRNPSNELSNNSNYNHIAFDFFDSDKLDDLFSKISKFGKIDFLVNNFAHFSKNRILNVTQNEFNEMMYLNCYLPLEMFRNLLQNNNIDGIINISSLAGITSKEKFPEFGCYAMSKSAITTLSQIIHTEFPSMKSLCIAPGAIKTKMLQRAMGNDFQGGADPSEVALIATDFILNYRPEINGKIIVLDTN